MKPDEILVVKVNHHVKGEVLKELQKVLLKQRETGVIVIPSWMDAQVVSGDIELRVEEGYGDVTDDILLGDDHYKRTCPFCDTSIIAPIPQNLFCECGAKYYYFDKVWLNRKTGEEVFEKEKNDG